MSARVYYPSGRSRIFLLICATAFALFWTTQILDEFFDVTISPWIVIPLGTVGLIGACLEIYAYLRGESVSDDD